MVFAEPKHKCWSMAGAQIDKLLIGDANFFAESVHLHFLPVVFH